MHTFLYKMCKKCLWKDTETGSTGHRGEGGWGMCTGREGHFARSLLQLLAFKPCEQPACSQNQNNYFKTGNKKKQEGTGEPERTRLPIWTRTWRPGLGGVGCVSHWAGSHAGHWCQPCQPWSRICPVPSLRHAALAGALTGGLQGRACHTLQLPWNFCPPFAAGRGVAFSWQSTPCEKCSGCGIASADNGSDIVRLGKNPLYPSPADPHSCSSHAGHQGAEKEEDSREEHAGSLENTCGWGGKVGRKQSLSGARARGNRHVRGSKGEWACARVCRSVHIWVRGHT